MTKTMTNQERRTQNRHDMTFSRFGRPQSKIHVRCGMPSSSRCHNPATRIQTKAPRKQALMLQVKRHKAAMKAHMDKLNQMAAPPKVIETADTKARGKNRMFDFFRKVKTALSRPVW